FFFSSRRRHTRFSRDWSSDVLALETRAHAPQKAPPAALTRDGGGDPGGGCSAFPAARLRGDHHEQDRRPGGRVRRIALPVLPQQGRAPARPGRPAPGGGRTRGHAGVRPVRRTASRSDPAGDRPGGVRGRPARGPAGTAPPAVRPGPAHAGTRRPLPRGRTAHGGRALRRAGQTGRPRPRRHRPAGRPGRRSPGPRRPARRPGTPGRHRAALGPRAGREITAPPKRLRLVHPDNERYVPMALPLSILDLAYIGKGETAADSFAASVELARRAEEWGYHRIWYAEHHNM